MNIFALTATYGQNFKPEDSTGLHSLKIYTGGFASKETAKERLEKEIKNYLQETKYKSYEIKEAIRKWLPFAHYKFLVEFK